MFQKYISTTGANLFLSADEQAWLSSHGVIRVGYQDNYLSFCAADKTTGELTGALKDYLEMAADCHENAHIDFQAIAYPNAAAAMEALERGEIDCMFPSNLSTSDGEAMDLIMSPSMLRTEIYAVVRKADQDSFAQKEQVVVAIEQNDPNYDAVLKDHFPAWQAVHYADIQACLRAVAEGKADCVLISNYQYNNLGKLCERYQLTPLTTGKEVDYSFAVNRGDTELYSILARTANIVSSASISAALAYYSAEDAKTTLAGFIRENLAVVVSVFVIMAAMALVMIQQQRIIRARRKADESQNMVENLNKQVYVDALTHVRNKGTFNNYMQTLQDRLDCGEEAAFAIAMFDCNNLKTINDQHARP
ncbi:MAG: transporter substrate-binding domain-containing protein [Clostridia bacterium]|nr:transporter substrate-binding domain-containing protein [Clostridia bacterium]